MRVRRPLYVLIPSVLLVSSARAAETPPPQLYEVVTETTMPHLEENLRYATTREQRCLGENRLWTLFTILQFAALKDCRLEQESHQEDAVSYALVCEGGHGTTGRATWQVRRAQSIGTLNVKLGGKNMTSISEPQPQRWELVRPLAEPRCRKASPCFVLGQAQSGWSTRGLQR